ncbi:hypothetical protein HPG69_013694, partial [Diceros bicornis minor]
RALGVLPVPAALHLGSSSPPTSPIIPGGAQGEGPACAMNPWLLACLVACCVGAWAPAVHAQGVFEDCCLAYHRHVGLALLRHAQGYLRQEVTGSCNLPAVIFFFRQRQRMVCGNPRARWVQNVMKILDARNKALSKSPHGTRRNFQEIPPKAARGTPPSQPQLLQDHEQHVSRISRQRWAASFSAATITLQPRLPQLLAHQVKSESHPSLRWVPPHHPCNPSSSGSRKEGASLISAPCLLRAPESALLNGSSTESSGYVACLQPLATHPGPHLPASL